NGVGNFTWVNGDTASIGSGGTAGTITIDDASGTVSASSINFNPVASGNYTVAAAAGKTLTLTGTAINVVNGLSPTISAPIAGTSGLTMTGPGTLNLTGANTFTGTVFLNRGTVVIGAAGNLGDSSHDDALG